MCSSDLLLVALAALALLAASCGTSGGDDAGGAEDRPVDASQPVEGGTPDTEPLGDDGCRNGDEAADAEAPEPTVPATPASALSVTDDIPGCGDEIPAGTVTEVTVHYIGISQSSGRPFDQSYGGDTVTFPVGAGRLIAGWDQGLIGMREGGRRTLVVPGDLGYADRPPSADIAVDDTLVFVIDLVAVH